MGYMVDRKHRDFTDEDIQKLSDTFTAFQDGMLEDVKGFCAVADLNEIESRTLFLHRADMLVLKKLRTMENHLKKR